MAPGRKRYDPGAVQKPHRDDKVGTARLFRVQSRDLECLETRGRVDEEASLTIDMDMGRS